MIPIKPQIISREFSDFDQLTEAAQAWNLELFKLDAVPFRGRIFQYIIPDFILSRGTFNCRLKQAGHPPPGYRTVVVPANPCMDMIWRSRHVTGNDLLLFPTGGELQAFSDLDFDVYTLSFPQHALLQAANELGTHHLDEHIRKTEVIRCPPNAIAFLRKQLHKMELNAAHCPPTAQEILINLVLLMDLAVKRPVSDSSGLLDTHLIQRIEKYLLDCPDEQKSIKELSSVVGASRRTIEYLFHEHVGMGPKTYINRLRLNQTRKLLRTGQFKTVAAAANAYGFWHMGQFAKDYRALFGELPSQTLATHS